MSRCVFNEVPDMWPLLHASELVPSPPELRVPRSRAAISLSQLRRAIPPEAVLKRSPLSDKEESGPGGGLRCPDCNRLYAFRSTLLRHYRYECGVEPRFQCHICLARFKRNERLTHHLHNVHSVDMNKQRKRSLLPNHHYSAQ